MIAGQAHTDPVSGLAGRIYTAWVAASDAGFAAGATTPGTAARNAVAAMCEAIAAGVIDELKLNAQIAINTTDVGLQRVSGTPTDGPATVKYLPAGAIL